MSLRDRILRPIDPAAVAPVKGTAHPLAHPQFDQGRLSPSQPLGHLALTFRLSPAQQADLDRLLREQQDWSSPRYHRWLTPDEYAQRFGMTPGDLQKVGAWLQSQGLRVDGVARNHNEIFFSGSVGQIEYALKTELHNYSVAGELHFANATDVALPAAFSSQVLGVRGLNNFSPKPRLRRASPRFTSNITGNHFLQPGDFAVLYDLTPLYNQGLDGTGQAIAVVGQTTISLSDIDAFRSSSAAKLPMYDPTLVLVPNTGNATSCSGDLVEADLDVEWSGGVAKGASIVYVYAGIGTGTSCSTRTKDVFDALQYAITNNVAPVISISYGNCEANLTASFVQTLGTWAQQANAQGQTISGPAGDSGAADCDTGNSATHGLAVDAPASVPGVTGVGGSEFTGDSKATVTNGCAAADPPYWAGSCNPNSGPTALQPIPETSWNDTAQSLAQNPPQGLSASGGGASTVFSKPSWQSGPGVPNDSARDVPDIALNASPFHDPYLTCTQGSCTNGFRDANNGLSAVGGTSAGAPAFAGILAILNQATLSANGQGNVNPTLYGLAVSKPSAFHDITSGNNMVPCTKGSTGCPNGGSIGFLAGTGYDQVTGLGSLDAFNMVSNWPGFSSAPTFAMGASPMSFMIASVGQSGSASVTLSAMSGFSGTIALTCTVASTATSKISCTPSPASVPLGGTNGTSASATVTVNALAASASLGTRGLRLLTANFLLMGALLVVFPRRRPSRSLFSILALGVLALGLMGFMAGCGGGSHPAAQQQAAAPVTYAVTLTGTDSANSSLTHSVNLNVTVQ